MRATVSGSSIAPIPDHRGVHLPPNRIQVEGAFAYQRWCEVVAQDRHDTRLRFHAEPFEAGISFDFAKSMHAIVRMHFDDHMIEPAEGPAALNQGVLHGQVQRDDLELRDLHCGNLSLRQPIIVVRPQHAACRSSGPSSNGFPGTVHSAREGSRNQNTRGPRTRTLATNRRFLGC